MKENIFGSNGWTPERLGSQKGKTFVITGGNAGAGFEASKLLLSRDAEVIMLNRNAEKSVQAVAELKDKFGDDTKVSFIVMDLASLDSVRDAAAEVLNTVPKIDALICNAAVAQVATQKLTKDGFEQQIGINHYGHFLLLNLLFEHVEETGKRIVVVGSNGYRMGGLKRIQIEDMNFDKNYKDMVTYSHSKLAQMVFAYELQRRIKAAKKDVKVYVCHPGAAKTTLAMEEASMGMRIMLTLLSWTPMAQSAEKGSWPEVMCATEENLEQLAYWGPTKRNEFVGPIGMCLLEPHALDEEDAAKLWELSEELTNCKWNL